MERITLNNRQEQDVTITFSNQDGGTAPITGVPSWSSSDEAIATFVANADGLGGVVRTVDGATGVATITVNVNGGPNGDQPVSGSFEVEVTADGGPGGTTVVNFAFGDVRNKTA